jgi:FKBP-type peptidyl-prolyl cis-trans isomerase
MSKGIRIEEVKVGDGTVAEKGRRVIIRYDGFLSRGDAFRRGVIAMF